MDCNIVAEKLKMRIQTTIKNAINEFSLIPEFRKKELKLLSKYIQEKKEITNLIFICTHNSRRSHLAQIWAQVAAYYYGFFNVNCYSGGTETTFFHPSAIEAIKQQGLLINKISEKTNPIYTVKYNNHTRPIICYSKKYNDFFNPQANFGAIMTCDNANQKCPFIPNSKIRIPIQYEDPKIYDGNPNELEKYLERSNQICREMFFAFSGFQMNTYK